MAVHDGGANEERSWSDLPGDLLAVIYLLSASAYDRARLAAVCSPWRAAAAWHPPLPALPLLLLSTGHGKRDREACAYSPEDGRVLQVPLTWFPWGNRLVGSYEGGWIATFSSSDEPELLVVNLFSGVRAALNRCRTSIRKVVFSKDPLSGSCILAAMTSRSIALHKVGCPNSGWTTACCGFGFDRYGDILDIAICNGELYAVTSDKLMVLEICMNKEGALVTFRVVRVDVAMSSLYTVEVPSCIIKYIFELHGKLAIAVEIESGHGCCKLGQFFRVFELADAINNMETSHRYTWVEVMSLGDHVLFLGPAGCCKVVNVSTVGRRGRVERNRIYYSKQHTYLNNNMACLARLDIGSCTVHCWQNETRYHMESIVSRGYHYRKNQDGANGCNGSVWLWPPDF